MKLTSPLRHLREQTEADGVGAPEIDRLEVGETSGNDGVVYGEKIVLHQVQVF